MSNEEMIREEETIANERAEETAGLGTAIMQRPIRILPNLRTPICVPCDATVRTAIEKMKADRVGCVLVTDGERMVGVFTERDVLTRVACEGVDPEQTRVDALMTVEPECLTLDDRIVFALNKMSVGGFRHIPLVDADGKPTGVVAMRAIVDYVVDVFRAEILNLPPEPGLAISRAREGA